LETEKGRSQWPESTVLTTCRANLNNELLALFGPQEEDHKICHGRIGASVSGEHLFAFWRPESRKHVDKHDEGFLKEFCIESNGASYNIFQPSTICISSL
jgi:hypothetical protein